MQPTGARIALLTESMAERAAYASAVTLLAEAGLVSEFVEDSGDLGPQAVVLCLARAGSDLPARCAHATTAPVLAIPWPDNLPATPDILLSTLSYPPELGIGVLAIGDAGMKNAALAAISIVALADAEVATWWAQYRRQQTESVLADRELT